MTHDQRNKKILKVIQDETARALTSKKTARESLIKDGIYTARGKLRVEFGGKSDKKHIVAA